MPREAMHTLRLQPAVEHGTMMDYWLVWSRHRPGSQLQCFVLVSEVYWSSQDGTACNTSFTVMLLLHLQCRYIVAMHDPSPVLVVCWYCFLEPRNKWLAALVSFQFKVFAKMFQSRAIFSQRWRKSYLWKALGKSKLHVLVRNQGTQGAGWPVLRD